MDWSCQWGITGEAGGLLLRSAPGESTCWYELAESGLVLPRGIPGEAGGLLPRGVPGESTC